MRGREPGDTGGDSRLGAYADVTREVAHEVWDSTSQRSDACEDLVAVDAPDFCGDLGARGDGWRGVPRGVAAGERHRGVATGVAVGVCAGVARGDRCRHGVLGRAELASEARVEAFDFCEAEKPVRCRGVPTGEVSRLRTGVRRGVAAGDRVGVVARGVRGATARGVSERPSRCRVGVAERARPSGIGQSKGLTLV